MRKKVLGMALAGLGLPALALAAQPILIRFQGRTVPVHETVQVARTAAGPVRVRTWSWHGANGATFLRVSESRSGSAAVPAWALAQMRAMQAQMRQMQLIEAAFNQSLLMPSQPIPALFGQPLLTPGFGLPVEVRVLQPAVPLQLVPVPVRVVAIPLPSPRLRRTQAAPSRHRGIRT